MKSRRLKLFVAAAAFVVMAGNVIANEVVESWGFGVDLWEARDNARADGRQQCIAKGYTFAAFELVDSTPSGGGYLVYGLSYCS